MTAPFRMVNEKESLDMNRSIRFTALLLLAVLGALALAACSPSYKSGDTTVLLTVDGMDVTHEHYRYVCMKNAVILANGDKDYFTGADAAAHLTELETQVERELRLYFAVESLAKEYGLKLSKDDVKVIQDEIKAMRKAVSGEEYDAYFESAFMTENLFFRQTKNYYLERNVFYHIIDEKSGVIKLSDEELRKDVEEHFMAASQILLSPDTKDGESLAYELKNRLENGEDFATLAGKYSTDTIRDTRYFAEGEMQSYFEETVESLEVGQIGVVKSDKGYHVIRRDAIDSAYVEKNLEAFRDTDLTRIYNLLLEERAERLEIVYTEAYTGLIRE